MKTRFAPLVLLVTFTLGCGVARADVADEWRHLAAKEIHEAYPAPAQRDAMLRKVDRAIDRARAATNGMANGSGMPAGVNERKAAATAVAAFATLESLVPGSREELESRLAVTFSRIPETDAKAEGARLGRRIAAELLRAPVE